MGRDCLVAAGGRSRPKKTIVGEWVAYQAAPEPLATAIAEQVSQPPGIRVSPN
jgi:hypothetical protein